MAPTPLLLCILLFTLLQFTSASPFISNDVFESHKTTGRNLLQSKKTCSVNFEGQNYTIITSQCKGPKYPKEQCCKSFKQFGCNFTEAINDVTTDCADTMFSYINLYGKYPPGLFANECQEGKEGLDCWSIAPAPAPAASGGNAAYRSALVVSTAGFLVVLLHLF